MSGGGHATCSTEETQRRMRKLYMDAASDKNFGMPLEAPVHTPPATGVAPYVAVEASVASTDAGATGNVPHRTSSLTSTVPNCNGNSLGQPWSVNSASAQPRTPPHTSVVKPLGPPSIGHAQSIDRRGEHGQSWEEFCASIGVSSVSDMLRNSTMSKPPLDDAMLRRVENLYAQTVLDLPDDSSGQGAAALHKIRGGASPQEVATSTSVSRVSHSEKDVPLEQSSMYIEGPDGTFTLKGPSTLPALATRVIGSKSGARDPLHSQLPVSRQALCPAASRGRLPVSRPTPPASRGHLPMSRQAARSGFAAAGRAVLGPATAR